MEVVSIIPRGYCFGVVNALNIVKKAVKENPNDTIHVLGIIIHNKFVKKALDDLGVVTHNTPNKTRLELLDEVNEGVVVFSAHGIGDDVIEATKAKGLKYYNATCPDVKKTQDIVRNYLSDGYQIIYIGKQNHPESEAMLSIDPKNIHFISSIDDVSSLSIDGNILITNQTTMSLYDIDEIIQTILLKYPHAKIVNEICNATRMRQEALMDLSDIDAVYVVGDHLSNNTNNLKKISLSSVDDVKLIESVLDINDRDLEGIKKVAVTSGASTPTYITNQVINYLSNYPNVTHDDKTIDYSKIL